MENVLIQSLNKALNKIDLCCIVKKETPTLLHCFLFKLSDGKEISKNIIDYSECKKLDVTYRKTDLHSIISNKRLSSFCSKELETYTMADKLNMLRR